jgi:hypothetical protein
MRFAILTGCIGLLATPSLATDTDWSQVDTILAHKAAVSGDVHRYGLPRSDLKVTLDGVALSPAFALGGWVAFAPMGDASMMMGDLVLTEAEVNPVMTRLLAAGIEITAVHNHLLRANPATFYMHVGGVGDPVQLARLLRAALEETRTPFDAPPHSTPNAAPVLDTAAIEAIIGFKGRTNGEIFQFGVPRSDSVKMHGMTIPGAMGSAIAINFQPTEAGKAAITGDFVAFAAEVTPLIRALRDNGIEVTAIHNHMLDDEPRAFFVHFWANDDALKLAKGLRAALDAVHVAAKG